MPIVLNWEAKHAPKFASPLLERIARSKKKTEWKVEVIFELGQAYFTLNPAQRAAFAKAKDIDHAFSWSNAPQGMDYWEGIHYQLEDN